MTIAFGSAALRALRRVVSCSAGPRVHSRGTRAAAPPRSFLDADVICELVKEAHALAMRCASIGAVAVACVESVSPVAPPRGRVGRSRALGFGLALAQSGARACEKSAQGFFHPEKPTNVVTNRNGHLAPVTNIWGT